MKYLQAEFTEEKRTLQIKIYELAKKFRFWPFIPNIIKQPNFMSNICDEITYVKYYMVFKI